MAESQSIELEDRLSELPDSLIIYIFEFLPITDVVRTTILSSRWRNLWTTTPCLILDSIDAIDKHRYFVNGVLKNWRGVKLSKFMVNLFTNEASFSYFDSWVRFATVNGVEVLYLRVTSPLNEDEIYMVPQCLYSCSSLKQLSIDGCTIHVQGGVQWNQLKSLRIDCFEISGNDVNHILSGCPQLEVFIFSVFDNVVNLSICSSSLKMLSVKKTIFYHEIEVMGTELRIGTPNLETLQIIGTPYGKCSLMNVSSLTHASLGFYCTSDCKDESCPWEDLIGKGLSQILPAIQHVEKITLSEWCIKVCFCFFRCILWLTYD